MVDLSRVHANPTFQQLMRAMGGEDVEILPPPGPGCCWVRNADGTFSIEVLDAKE